MILKFNNGKGALCCDSCKKIVMERFYDYEYMALCKLNESGMEWFCEKCCVICQREQNEAFVKEVNSLDVELLNKKYRKSLVV